MATGYKQALFESIPGNETNSPTASTKLIYHPLITADAQPVPDPMERDDELRNQDQPLPLLSDAYDPSWGLDMRAYPDSLGFELKGLLGSPTTTAGNGVITDPDAVVIPAGATRHVWTAPFGPSGVSPQTTQRIYAWKDEGFYAKLKGCATQNLSLDSPEKGGVMLKCGGPALYMTPISNPSLTPSYESLAVRPFVRGNLTLSWLSGSATTEDFTIGCTNPVETVRSLGIASLFPDVMEKASQTPIAWSGSIPKRHIDPDDYDALVNATGFAATAKWVGSSVIASAYTYKLFIEMSNVQYVSGGPNALSNNRRIGAQFDWKATYAGTASVTVTLVNATTSYV